MKFLQKLYGLFTPSVASLTEDYEKKQSKLKDSYRQDIQTVVEVNKKKSKAYQEGINELLAAKFEADDQAEQAKLALIKL